MPSTHVAIPPTLPKVDTSVNPARYEAGTAASCAETAVVARARPNDAEARMLTDDIQTNIDTREDLHDLMAGDRNGLRDSESSERGINKNTCRCYAED